MYATAGLVLIVEDELALREPLEHLLKLRGYDVMCAAGATEARVLLRDRRPDAAIVDLKLPDGSGRDVVTDMPAGMPVIIFSATVAESGRLEVTRPHTRLVEKPCSLTWLIGTLDGMLRQRASVLQNPLPER